MQAIVNIAYSPWRNIVPLYSVANASTVCRPALSEAPDAWTIALKFVADGTINGPGNFAFDAEATSWLLTTTRHRRTT